MATGHTGFKGAWLTFCLLLMGPRIEISSNIITSPSLFKTLGLKKVKNKFLDIKNFNKVKNLQNFKPDSVFHLAAQSLQKSLKTQ